MDGVEVTQLVTSFFVLTACCIGRVEFLRRLRPLTLLLENQTKTVMGLRQFGLQVDGFFELRLSFAGVAGLEINSAQRIVRIR